MADTRHFIDIDGIKIPIKIIVERRSNARVSIGGSNVILRVPKALFFKTDLGKHIDWATQWLRQLKAQKPTVLDKFKPKREYKHGQIFSIGEQEFVLNIITLPKDTGSIKLKEGNILFIEIPDRQGYDQQKLIKNLLIRFCQKYFLPTLVRKVNYYNQTYFNKPIKNIKLKYNKTNWGSCSTGKNLNFSVRLFFAPEDVIDYVVVHELAHLVEMNHSDKFWKIVSDIMPNYKQKEHILKINNGLYDF